MADIDTNRAMNDDYF